MCEDQFRDSLQKDTAFATEWTVPLHSPFLASLISFCTHPLPRVSNGAPASPQNTPSSMPYMDHREESCPARHPFIGGLNDQHVSRHTLVAAAALYTKMGGVSISQGRVNNRHLVSRVL